MSLLIAARHGQSASNERRIWTGLNDVPLTDRGREEALLASLTLAEITIHAAHTSQLQRAQDSLKIMLKPQLNKVIPVISAALNERNYGVFTGVSKDHMREELGEEEFQRIRSSWDCKIEGGQSLRDVYAIVAPYYQKVIVPQLIAGLNVLVVSHGNPLRALAKEIEGISNDGIEEVQFGTGGMRIYDMTDMGEFNGVTVHDIGAVH